MDVIATLPVLAAGFAIPQFVPQIVKLRRTNDTAGLSTPWALLTGINNVAWFGYFAASRYWFALLPSSSAALLGGGLGIMLSRRHRLTRRRKAMIAAWIIVLGAAASVDRRLLGATLTGAFLIQVVLAVTTAYRTRHPTGIARGTWLLILGEVSCWAILRCPARRATHHPRHHRRGQRPVDVEPNPNHPTRCGLPWSVAERSDLPTTSPAAVP